MSDFQKYYEGLNAEQREAVDAIEGPVMVIAGAGTGKTQILAVRIAKILQETQIDPFNILCLTFTEAGVTAMRQRLISIIGPAAYHIKICTFHGFCNEIIKENSEEFVVKRDFEQIDDLEKIMLLQEIIDELGVRSVIRPNGDPYFYQFDLESRIKDLKKENFSPARFSESLDQIENFLKQIQPHTESFTQIKGSPAEEEINKMSPDLLLKDFQAKSTIEQTYAKYLGQIWQDYQSALTGQKRVDSTKRTAFKKTLKDFLETLSKNLPKQRELAKAYQLYQDKLIERSRYDYEDMILMVSQRFETDAKRPDGGLLRKYQETYQYILVDEYQDTNSAQNRTVELLGSFFDSPNLFVVGDDDQSIYRFQGASVENIIDYYKRYKTELKLITLVKNYRSQQSILDAASTMIENNQVRIASYLNENSSVKIDKKLQSQSKHPVLPLELSIFETEAQESYQIVQEIKTMISQGVSPSEIAILFRHHSDALELTEVLLKEKVPFELKAGQDILQDLQVGKLLSLFRTIENPHSNDALAQTLFADFLKIPRSDLLSLTYYYSQNRLERQGFSLFHLLNQPEHLKQARLTDPAAFHRLHEQIINWRDSAENQTLNLFFETVIKQSGFLQHLMESDSRIETLNKLNTLFRQIKNATRKNHHLTITAFLEDLQLRSENRLRLLEEPLQISRDAVQLMTAHASKGLEFEHVFIIRATSRNWGKGRNMDKINLPKGLIKTIISDEKLEGEEDERRLFYVALTRAKKLCHLSYSKFRSEANKVKEDLPSMFVSEIPAELVSQEDYTNASPVQIEALESLLLQPSEPPFSDIEEGLLRKAAAAHVISPTSLNNYLTCPRKFMYQNLLRIPQAKNRSASLGTAIHAALDKFFREYNRKKIKPPVEFILLHFKASLDKELLKEKDYQELLQIGQNIISDFYQDKQESFSSDTITEYNFSSHGVNIEGIPITGKVDKIEPNSENNLVVTDFKTGNADSGLGKIRHGEDYWRQLVFYKLLCDHSPRFKAQFPNQKVAATQIEFLEKSRSKKIYITEAIDADQESLNEVIENVKFVHQQINALQFEKIEKSDPCERCPFYNICWKS